MKNKIFKISLIGLNLLTASWSWFSIARSVNVSGSSTWVAPIVSFSSWFVFLILFLIIEKRKWLVFWVSLFSFWLSLIFVFSWFHLVILTLGALFILVSSQSVQKELSTNIKISSMRTARLNRNLIILALAMALSSQYYFEIENKDQNQLIPEFDFGNILKDKVGQNLIQNILPDAQGIEDADLTVDQVILKDYYQKKEENGLPETRDLTLKKLEEEQVLEAGREELGRTLGKEITGQEKVGDLFSEMINQRINEAVTPSFSNGTSKTIPLILALVLFITVWSVGAFFSRFLTYMDGLLFWISKRLHLVEIKKVPIEKEIIVE